MDYDKTKHLEFVSKVIERMAQNSFTIKEFAITFFTWSILSQLVQLEEITSKEKILLLWIFLMLVFWFLDTWFLRRERGFRALFNKVRLSSSDLKYILKPEECDSFCSILFSCPNSILYIVLIWIQWFLFFYF